MKKTNESYQETAKQRHAEVQQVLKLIKTENIRVPEACKQVGIPMSAYYGIRQGKSFQLIEPKKAAKPKRSYKPREITLPVPNMPDYPFQGGKIFALVGAPKEVMEAIRSLG